MVHSGCDHDTNGHFVKKRIRLELVEHKEEKMDFGTKIAYYRKERGMTQEELASQFDISNQAVSKWETGQSYPDVELLPKIADFFEISLDELFGREFVQKSAAEVSCEAVQNNEAEAVFEQAALSAPITLPEAVTLPVPEQRDTCDHSETLYAVLYQGSRLIHEEEIKKRFGHITNKLSFEFSGPALNVYSVFSVTCEDVQGDVTAGGYVECDSVAGKVTAGGYAECTSVEGSVTAGGYVECDSVGQNVVAGGYAECGDVGGKVAAGGYVECGDVGESVAAGGHVECSDVGCNVKAGGNVECGDVGGDVSAEGDVECGDVAGSVTAGGKVG